MKRVMTYINETGDDLHHGLNSDSPRRRLFSFPDLLSVVIRSPVFTTSSSMRSLRRTDWAGVGVALLLLFLLPVVASELLVQIGWASALIGYDIFLMGVFASSTASATPTVSTIIITRYYTTLRQVWFIARLGFDFKISFVRALPGRRFVVILGCV